MVDAPILSWTAFNAGARKVGSFADLRPNTWGVQMILLMKEILVEVMLLVGAGAITFVPLWISARTTGSCVS